MNEQANELKALMGYVENKHYSISVTDGEIKTIMSYLRAAAKQMNEAMDACTNVGIPKVIYFIKLLLNIAFIAVPIGLIVFGLIDFSKSVASGDEKDGKKNLNLFIKRLIYGALVFCVPWIVNVVMHLLGDLTKDVNWTDCYNNANKEYIDAHEE